MKTWTILKEELLKNRQVKKEYKKLTSLYSYAQKQAEKLKITEDNVEKVVTEYRS